MKVHDLTTQIGRDNYMNTLSNKKQKDYLEYSVLQLIEDYKDGTDDPLDGDEVDSLMQIIKAKVNLHEGNITEHEYNQILG